MNLLKEERYYHPNLLNKWFALSSLVFLGSLIAMFGNDYIRSWKSYQRDFTRLEIAKTHGEIEGLEYDKAQQAELEGHRWCARAVLQGQSALPAQYGPARCSPLPVRKYTAA
jgi:hypothetical protein